jgi:hypothetical protein
MSTSSWVEDFSAEVPIRHPAGRFGTATIACRFRAPQLGESNRQYRIDLTAWDQRFEGVGLDYFDALCRVREQLEGIDYWLLCYGSSLNVFPSGMCRDMGNGLVAYRDRSKSNDIVQIFETGPDVQPVSVAEQRAFAERRWRQVPS